MNDPFMDMRRQMQQMQQMQQALMSGMPMMQGFPDQYHGAPQRQPSHYRSSAPHVEEVPEDEPAVDGTQQGAIVEEPDDPPQPSRRYREREPHTSARPRHNQQQMQAFQDPFQDMFPSFGGFGGLGALMNMATPSAGGASYSYSSFTSSGGPGGVTYQETKTHRVGPGGVSESKHTVRDGRTGEDKMRLTRGLGDRKRTLEQARRHGQEIHRDVHLSGFERHEDAEHFDDEWQRAAGAALGPAPGRERSRTTPLIDFNPAPRPWDGGGQQPRYGGYSHNDRFRGM